MKNILIISGLGLVAYYLYNRSSNVYVLPLDNTGGSTTPVNVATSNGTNSLYQGGVVKAGGGNLFNSSNITQSSNN